MLILLTPFIIARIGPDHYGLFVLLMAISGFMGIMNLGLGDATLRFVAHYYGKNDLAGINRIVGATFSIFILAGFVVWATLFFGAGLIASLIAIPPQELNFATQLVQLTSFSVGIGLVGAAFSSIPQALQRYDINTRVNLVVSLFQVCGTVLVLLFAKGLYELVLLGVATTFFSQAISIFVARALVPNLRISPSPTRRGLKEVFGYGFFTFLTHILGTIWSQADRLLLGSLVGPAAVAHLSVPAQLSLRGSMAVGSIGAPLFPRFGVMQDKDKMADLFLDATWLLLIATILIFVPLTALFPDFLRLWIDPQFAEHSAFVAQIIAFSCIVRGAFVPYDALFRGIGKPHLLTLVFLATGATSLITNLLLIPRFGLSGAGYAYLLTTFWGFAAIAFAWRHVLGKKSFMPLIRAVLIPVALGYLALFIITLLRAKLGPVSWSGLIGLGLSALVVTSAFVFTPELGVRGGHSRLIILRRFIPRFLQSRAV